MPISDPFSAFLFLDMSRETDPFRLHQLGSLVDGLPVGFSGWERPARDPFVGVFLPCFLLARGHGCSRGCVTLWLLQLLWCTCFPLFQLSLGSSNTVFPVPLQSKGRNGFLTLSASTSLAPGVAASKMTPRSLPSDIRACEWSPSTLDLVHFM